MKVTVSAPGKVVLLGEYAVLEDAPALVMAVDRRVTVTLESWSEPRCAVRAPSWTQQTAYFTVGGTGAEWSADNSRRFDLAGHVIQAFFDNNTAGRPFRLTLDSAALMTQAATGPVKLGLGSSAALTVAIWHALGYSVAVQHESTPAPDLAELVGIHSRFQGRRGSGLDVAASLHGGLIEYHRSPPRVRPAALPSGLQYCFVWTGQQAATGRFLAELEQWRRRDDESYRSATKRLSAVARAAIQAADADDTGTFLDEIEAYAAGLKDLGCASGTAILSAPHRRLDALARQCGVVYKPCGAGGGDIGVAMSWDRESLARFRARLEPERFRLLSLQLERSGVTTQLGN